MATDNDIGSLVIKLKAETAELQAGLTKAQHDIDAFAKKAEGSGKAVSFSMRESRESVMALGEVFGVHLPASITRTIGGLELLGPALEAALPFAAIAVGAVLLFEHLTKMREEAAKNAEEWKKVGDEGAQSLHKLDEELLQVQERADILAGRPMAALRDRIKLIDEQTLDNIISEFTKLEQTADKALHGLTKGFFTAFLEGDDRLDEVKTKFTAFNTSYDEALKKYQDTLQSGTKKEQADAFAEVQKTISDAAGDAQRAVTAYSSTLRRVPNDQIAKEGAKDYQRYLDYLHEVNSELQKNIALSHGKKSNETTQYEQTQIIHVKPIDWHAYGESLNKKKEATVKEQEAEAEANRAFAKATQDQLTKQITYVKALASAKADEAALNTVSKDKQGLDVNENQYKLGLISLQQYLNTKKTLLREEGIAEIQYAESQKAQAQASYDEAMKASDLNARINALHRLEQATRAASNANTQYQISMHNMDAEMKHSTSFLANFQAGMKQQKSLTAQFGDNLATAMKGFNHALVESIVMGKNFGQAMRQVGQQVVMSIMEQILAQEEQIAITYVLKALHLSGASDNKTQQQSAAQLAGANMVATWAKAPWPIDAMAPAMGAVAMASAMSFEVGGKIPGEGPVPIIGHGGETVVTKALTDRVESAQGGGGTSEVHHHMTYAPQINAVDRNGVEDMLKQHAASFHREFKSWARRANK